MEDLTGFLAVLLSLSIPIVAIIGVAIYMISKNRKEVELKKSIIENNLSPESIRLLVEEQAKPKNGANFGVLQTAFILIGLGAGMLTGILMGLDREENKLGLFVVIAFGIGLGMLTSFFITRKLEKKDMQQEHEEQEQ